MSSITDESSEKGKNHSKSDYFYIRLFSNLLKYKINYFLDTYLRTYGLIYRLIPAFPDKINLEEEKNLPRTSKLF